MKLYLDESEVALILMALKTLACDTMVTDGQVEEALDELQGKLERKLRRRLARRERCLDAGEVSAR